MIKDLIMAILIVSAVIYIDILIRYADATEVILEPYKGLSDGIQAYHYDGSEKCECYCFDEDID